MTYYTTMRDDETGERIQGRFVDLHDYIDAYLEYSESLGWDDKYVKKHKDYAKARYDAYVAAFGVDVSRYGYSDHGPGDPREFFWNSAVKTYNQLHDPFGISLEGPGSVEDQQFKKDHAAVVEAVTHTKTLIKQLLIDGIRLNSPDSNKTLLESEVEIQWEGATPDPRDLF